MPAPKPLMREIVAIVPDDLVQQAISPALDVDGKTDEADQIYRRYRGAGWWATSAGKLISATHFAKSRQRCISHRT